jgi:radical SAM superfamily enzyme YgiQ (UPF0313 family)
MPQSGSILLVSCYELGHQPLALASPVGFLQRAGYSPSVLDLSVTGFDEEKLTRATFIGISVPMHTALRLGVYTAKRIREINASSHVCFYGLYASLNVEYLLEQRIADSVIGGEFEGPLLALIEALQRKTENEVHDCPLDIDGVSSRGRICSPSLKRLSFASPNFHRLPKLESYARLAVNGTLRLAGYVEASRGCLHHCLHCPIPPVYKGRFFVVPMAIVLEGIRSIVQSGASHITFGDPDFLNGPLHSLRVVRAMHAEFPEVTFDFTAKVQHLLKHRALLPEFAEAGCIFIISAFESLSDTVLTNLEKGHSREDIHKVLEIFRNTRIALRPTWVPFTPWATIDDFIDLLEYVRREHLIQNIDPVQFTIRLLVPPGSMLLQQPEMEPFLGPLDQVSFTYRWTHPDPRMDELQKNVASVVERAIESKERVATIFARVRQLAHTARGEQAFPFGPDMVPSQEPPRLTESWFC